MIFTDSEYQGKGSNFFFLVISLRVGTTLKFSLMPFFEGMMSQLIREAFAHSPEGIFILEASTPKSRDQYAHLGFEV